MRIPPTNIIVPGRGHERGPNGEFHLSSSSEQRVAATINYFTDNQTAFEQAASEGLGAAIVMSGGYASLASGNTIPPLPYERREGTLMYSIAKAAGVPVKYLFNCASSTSTLENILRVQEEGILHDLGPGNPLGIVTQESQWPRFCWFAQRIFKLPEKAVVLIKAGGETDPAIIKEEQQLMRITKLLYGPARTSAGLRRAERLAAAGSQIATRFGVEPPAASYLRP